MNSPFIKKQMSYGYESKSFGKCMYEMELCNDEVYGITIYVGENYHNPPDVKKFLDVIKNDIDGGGIDMCRGESFICYERGKVEAYTFHPDIESTGWSKKMSI
jgi:hypothetical protein